jgi:putative two-component system response regulator
VTSNSKILIIDDDPRLVELMRFALSKVESYNASCETRPRHALEAARAIRPDLILLDVEMPGISGGEVAKALAEEPALRSIPILFVTSLLSKDETGSRRFKRGNQFYMAKLVEPVALIKAVGEMLAESPRKDWLQ